MTGKVSQCYLSKTYLEYLGGFKLTLDITRKIIICIIYSHFYCISSTYNKLKMVVKKSTKPLWTSNWVACGPLPLSFFSATIQSKRKRKMKNKKKALEKQNGQNKCSHESWMIAASWTKLKIRNRNCRPRPNCSPCFHGFTLDSGQSDFRVCKQVTVNK